MEKTESLREMAARYIRDVCPDRLCNGCTFNDTGHCVIERLASSRYEMAADFVTGWAKAHPDNSWGAEFTKRFKQAFPEMKGTIPQYIMDRLYPFEFFDRENRPTDWRAPYVE